MATDEPSVDDSPPRRHSASTPAVLRLQRPAYTPTSLSGLLGWWYRSPSHPDLCGSNILQAAGISVIATADMLFRMSKELQDEAAVMALSAQNLMDDAARMGSDMMDVPVEPSRDNENANPDDVSES